MLETQEPIKFYGLLETVFRRKKYSNFKKQEPRSSLDIATFGVHHYRGAGFLLTTIVVSMWRKPPPPPLPFKTVTDSRFRPQS